LLNSLIERFQTKVEEKPKKSVKLIPISDPHVGGTTGLFPYYDGTDLGFEPHKRMTGNNGEWRFANKPYMPSAKQYAVWQQFKKCGELIALERDKYRFVVVLGGDIIDGNHHHSHQLATPNISEQSTVAIWIFKYFKHLIGFDKNLGDMLYVGQGTEVHDGDEENTIADELGAEILPDGQDTFDFMPMDINGSRFWFLHQGATAGKGITEGNALHNWMKNQYFTCLEDKRVIPDCVISGHYHKNVYDTFTRKDRTMHGIILPPLQLKTRFGYRVAAAELDSVGIRTIDINPIGEIKVNKAMIIQSREDVVVV